MIRAIVVDDEQPAIERLKKLLKPYSDIDIISEASDGLIALSCIEEKKPDIVFLDVEMPLLNGIEVAKTLGIHGPLIVFVTAYDEFALEAFESSAIDYLVKPINSTRLEFAIEKIRKSLHKEKSRSLEVFFKEFQLTNQPRRLAVKVGTKFEVFDPELISVAQSRDHYTSLSIDGKRFLSDDSLELVLSRLDPHIFIRIRRGAFINVKYLKELKREGDRKYLAILNDKFQSQLLVSRERLPLLKKFLGIT